MKSKNFRKTIQKNKVLDPSSHKVVNNEVYIIMYQIII